MPPHPGRSRTKGSIARQRLGEQDGSRTLEGGRLVASHQRKVEEGQRVRVGRERPSIEPSRTRGDCNAGHPSDADGFLDFGELCLEGIGQGARRAHRHLLALSWVVDAPQDAVDAVGAWMMTIVAQLAVNEQRDDETRSHPDRKADDVDQGIPAVPTERAKGDFEITG